jgi:hypothetical protein
MLPKPDFAAVESDDRPRDRDRLVLEGNPPEASLPAPSEFGLLRPSITALMLTRREITEQRCRDWRRTLVEFNGESDHIHILMSLPPNLDLSRFVNNLKTTAHG